SWSINSYSGLFISPFHSGKHEEVSGGSEYDYWILSHRGGAVFGDMIHDLLEKTDFTDPADWERRVADTGKRYTGVFGREDTGNYKRLIHHTMNAELPSEQSNRFTLSSVKNSLKKPEMEFYFQINTLNSKELTEIIRETAGSDRYTTPRRKHIRGFMRGFIDLVFQHNSKYYILDWKTNNLGPSLSVYAPENKGIERAMTENNYHMQYLIYSVALKRYMELRGTPFSKESFGGVYYLFLRGVREDSGYGVFYRSGSSLVGPVSELDLVFKGKNL
ncbi:MAG: PD-(D/E)XK nuclease family protein, partial [Chitinivibrionales bacterium]